MSVAAAPARLFNLKFISSGAMTAFLLAFSGVGSAGPVTLDAPSSEEQPMPKEAMDGDVPTMGELRTHAATIADILEIASERVDHLAATDAEKPALMEAIRHELSLSRRWNRHLGTILDEVAETRRALKAREREAAKEIAQMTALAEEARLELITLKKVLIDGLEGEAGDAATSSESSLNPGDPIGLSRQWASNRAIGQAAPTGFDGHARDLEDARASLSSMQDAQTSAVQDVEAVRAKIIEALETLADAQGNLPIKVRGAGASLSSEDITAWAASMATKLNRKSTSDID